MYIYFKSDSHVYLIFNKDLLTYGALCYMHSTGIPINSMDNMHET